jgi:glucokinase
MEPGNKIRRYVIGTDIGGSHVSAILVDMRLKCIVAKSFSKKIVNSHESANTILTQWAKAILEAGSVVDKSEILGVGFAMPGPFDYVHGIAKFEGNDKYEKLNGVNIINGIKGLLGFGEEVELRFINDATGFAIGESWFGKIVGYKKAAAITLGTGFGSAFLENGIPVLEGEGVPKYGCVWHLPYKKGIADEYFSTRWFEKRYAEKTGNKILGVKELAGKALSDAVSREVFQEFGSQMGEFLGPWLRSFEAEALVLGGNITNAYNLFIDPFSSKLKDQGVKVTVLTSALKESAAMAGSARLFDNASWEKIKCLLPKM